MKRLVYLTQQFPVVTETFTINEVMGLKERGIDVVVHALRPSPPDFAGDERSLPSAELVRLESVRPRELVRVASRVMPTWSSRRVLAAARGAALGRELDADRDHVHAQFPLGASDVGYFAHVASGVSFSFSGHTYHHLELMPEKLKASGFVIVGSEFERDLLARRYGDRGRQRASIFRLGVPRRRPRIGYAPGTIASVGTLTGKKGHDVLIDAVGALVRRGLRVTAEIIGEGPDRPALEDQIVSLGLAEHVSLPGALSHPETLAKVARAEIFALCCRETSVGDHDCLPVALMDAMSLAVPCVSSAAFGIPELIEDGYSGLLAAQGDKEGVADRLETILLSPGLGTQLGEAGHHRVHDRYDLSRNLDALAELFRVELA